MALETENSLNSIIKKILINAQTSAASHQRDIARLKAIFKNVDFEHFCQTFFKYLFKLIRGSYYKEKNPYYDRFLEFMEGLVSSLVEKVKSGVKTTNNAIPEENGEVEVEHPFVAKILEYLLDRQTFEDENIRFRSVELITRILNQLEGIEISEELFDKLQKELSDRLWDPKISIRVLGVKVMSRFQNISDRNDAVIGALINRLEDIYPKVRVACVELIAVTPDTLQALLLRVRDVNVDVRLAAFKRLARVPKSLKIVDRRRILQSGFLIPSEKILNFMPDFVDSWLEKYNGDILKLMEAVRLDANTKDLELTMFCYKKLLGVLFKTKPLNTLKNVLNLVDKLLPIEELCWETAAFWRIFVDLLKERELDEEYEAERNNYLPDLVNLCQYIKKYIEETAKNEAEMSTVDIMEQQFILIQLFSITQTYDFSDPATAKALNALITQVLEKSSFTSEVIRAMIGNLSFTIPSFDSRCRFVCEIVSEILCPLNTEEQTLKEQERQCVMAKFKMEYNILIENQRQALDKADYLEAERLKLEMQKIEQNINELKNRTNEIENSVAEKRTDAQTLLKCLNILIALMKAVCLKKIPPTLDEMKKEFVSDLLGHENDDVRVKAFECYALFCICDENAARHGIQLFAVPILVYNNDEECHIPTLIVCAKAVADLLRIYGTKLLAEPMKGNKNEEEEKPFTGGISVTDLIQGLMVLIHDEDEDLEETATTSICKLLIDGRIKSSEIICQLVLKWCNPVTDPDQRSKQMIGLTFKNLAERVYCADELEGAVLKTVKVLANAPRNSPFVDVNIEQIAKFLLALCSSTAQGDKIHSNLAVAICMEMLKPLKAKLMQVYSKMLLLLTLPVDELIIKDLLKLADEILDGTNERTTRKNVTKFIANLNEKLPEVDNEENKTGVNDTNLNNTNINNSSGKSAIQSQDLFSEEENEEPIEENEQNDEVFENDSQNSENKE